MAHCCKWAVDALAAAAVAGVQLKKRVACATAQCLMPVAAVAAVAELREKQLWVDGAAAGAVPKEK